jgi:ATP synthase protein I
MVAGPGGPDPLHGLRERIEAARDAQRPKRGTAGEKYKAGSVAWRMVTELVVGIVVGGAMGWGLDGLFGTLPLFLLVMGTLGFAAGIRAMLRTAAEMRERDAAERRSDAGSGPPNGG